MFIGSLPGGEGYLFISAEGETSLYLRAAMCEGEFRKRRRPLRPRLRWNSPTLYVSNCSSVTRVARGISGARNVFRNSIKTSDNAVSNYSALEHITENHIPKCSVNIRQSRSELQQRSRPFNRTGVNHPSLFKIIIIILLYLKQPLNTYSNIKTLLHPPHTERHEAAQPRCSRARNYVRTKPRGAENSIIILPQRCCGARA